MIFGGLLLLARGRAEGIKAFGNSTEALNASLAPLIAFPLVGAARTAFMGQPLFAAIDFLSRLCAVLALPLITYEFARLAGRESEWRRTVAALNWSFWMIVPLLLIAAVLGAVMVMAGVAETPAERAVLGLLIFYLLWYQWFIGRAGLRLRVWQAVLLVTLNVGAIVLLSAAPLYIGYLLHVTIA